MKRATSTLTRAEVALAHAQFETPHPRTMDCRVPSLAPPDPTQSFAADGCSPLIRHDAPYIGAIVSTPRRSAKAASETGRIMPMHAGTKVSACGPLQDRERRDAATGPTRAWPILLRGAGRRSPMNGAGAGDGHRTHPADGRGASA
jgi:hypothetical protein